MRIVHVITTINLGGAENHLYDLVSEQVRQGHEILIVYLKGDHAWKNKYQDLGVKTHCLLLNNYLMLHKSLALRGLIKSFKPDLVHTHMPPAELTTRLALLGLSGIPLILSKHNDEPFAPYIGNFLLANWTARRAQRIICISQAVQDYVGTWMTAKNRCKLRKVYYAVNIDKFRSAVPNPEFILPSNYVIGTIARLMPQKSLPTLLKAFAALLARVPESRLIVIGTGPLEAELKNLADELEISKRVQWLGLRKDIPSLIKCFDVFALTSIYEGFGLVLLEAMAAGVSIVASKVSAIPEVLDQGRCGMLFEAQDDVGLLNCLLKMHSDKVRSKYIEQGKLRVETYFSIQKMAIETETIYGEVLADRRVASV